MPYASPIGDARPSLSANGERLQTEVIDVYTQFVVAKMQRSIIRLEVGEAECKHKPDLVHSVHSVVTFSVRLWLASGGTQHAIA